VNTTSARREKKRGCPENQRSEVRGQKSDRSRSKSRTRRRKMSKRQIKRTRRTGEPGPPSCSFSCSDS
jgi:hypothetical protein